MNFDEDDSSNGGGSNNGGEPTDKQIKSAWGKDIEPEPVERVKVLEDSDDDAGNDEKKKALEDDKLDRDDRKL